MAHVADPVRLEDRFAPGHGQGVEGADGLLAVFLQIGEVGGFIPVVDSVQDAQVDFHELFDIVEDAPDGDCLVASRELGHVPVRQEVDIDFRPDRLDRLGQGHGQLLR